MRAPRRPSPSPAPGGVVDHGWRRRPGRLARLALVALVATLGLAACGDGDDDPPEAQPAPTEDDVFAEGFFDSLPVPPRADPVSERSEDGDVTSRSWTVDGSTPDEVIDFYRSALEGWQHVGTEDVGAARRGDFTRDGRGLRVTAQAAPTVGSGGAGDTDPTVQLSLQVGPPERVFVG